MLKALSLIFTSLVSVAAQAAPVDKIDCIYNQWSEEDRLEVLKTLDEPVTPLLAAAAKICASRNNWNNEKTQIASMYAAFRALGDYQNRTIADQRGQVELVDSYFESNKTELVANGSDNEFWRSNARTTLGNAGFPVSNSRAFESAMTYIGTRVLVERLRADFAVGRLR
jgi:hypothetical protein